MSCFILEVHILPDFMFPLLLLFFPFSIDATRVFVNAWVGHEHAIFLHRNVTYWKVGYDAVKLNRTTLGGCGRLHGRDALLFEVQLRG